MTNTYLPAKRGLCAVGKEAMAGSFPAGFVGGSGMLPLGQSEQDVECRKATD